MGPDYIGPAVDHFQEITAQYPEVSFGLRRVILEHVSTGSVVGQDLRLTVFRRLLQAVHCCRASSLVHRYKILLLENRLLLL